MRIEICGGIGAGKTKIAKVLSTILECSVVFETYRSVPFWEPFFKDPLRYSFPKNIGFVLSHGERLHTSLGSTQIVSDFALIQDLAYAALSRDDEELRVVTAIYERMVRLVGEPSILVRVCCDLDQQLDRIKNRGRMAERSADPKFLQNLNTQVEHNALKLARKTEIPYFVFDTSKWNSVASQNVWKSRLISVIASIHELSKP